MSNNEITRGFALVTGSRNLWNQGERNIAIRTLADALESSEVFTPADMYSICVTLSEYYGECRNDWSSAEYYAKTALESVSKLPVDAQTSAFARYSAAMARANINKHAYAEAIENCDDAAEAYRLSGNTTGVANALLLKAETQVRIGKCEDAIETCQQVRPMPAIRSRLTELNAVEALANANLGNYNEMQRLSHNNLDRVHKELGDGKYNALLLSIMTLLKDGDMHRFTQTLCAPVDFDHANLF